MKGSLAAEAETLFKPGKSTIIRIRVAKAHAIPDINLIFFISMNII